MVLALRILKKSFEEFCNVKNTIVEIASEENKTSINLSVLYKQVVNHLNMQPCKF